MPKLDENNANFYHTCINCKESWYSIQEHPVECAKCRARFWDKRAIELYVPIPVFNHKEKKELKCLYGKCPYCGSTTGTDSVGKFAFCYGCDACFSIVTLQFLGVLVGIGSKL